MAAYAPEGIYGADHVVSALQAHFERLEPQMERNLARLYGTQDLESRMAHWRGQCGKVMAFAEERAEYMLWYTNRACW